MKIQRLLALAALLLPTLVHAQVEYFGYFLPVGSIKGNTEDSVYKDKNAFEILSYSITAENTSDLINSPGAGNIVLDRLQMLIETDGALYTGFLQSLTVGTTFNEFIIEGRRNADEADVFIKVSFKNVRISNVLLEGTQGDRGVFNVVVDYEAIKVEGYQVNLSTGQNEKSNEAIWSRVNADATYTGTD